MDAGLIRLKYYSGRGDHQFLCTYCYPLQPLLASKSGANSIALGGVVSRHVFRGEWGLFRFDAEEVDTRGTICCRPAFPPSVKETEPYQSEGSAAPDGAETERAKEVADGPGRGDTRADRDAGVNLLEAAKEPAMTGEGEASKVVGTAVNLLHEGRVRVHQATRTQDAVNLFDDHMRLEDVLYDRLDPYAVD